MKFAFITTFYKKEELKEVDRIKDEIKQLGLSDFHIYIIDNTKDNRGYAAGINKGIKNAIKDQADIFVIFNLDISFKNITASNIKSGLKHFDILGFRMKQHEFVYYGGEIDKWRLSGGLCSIRPDNKYQIVDFISGSLMFINKRVINMIGLFNEEYFMYYEDVDYCFKAKMNGFKVGICRDSIYEHFENSKNKLLNKNYLLAKSRIKFFLKYSNLNQKIREIIRIPKTIYEYIR